MRVGERMRPPPGARFASGATGQIPLEITGYADRAGPFYCTTKHVSVPDMEPTTLYRALNLDPVRFYFDLPPSVRRYGLKSNSSLPGNGIRDFRIHMVGQDEPVALGVILPSSGLRHRDVDPVSRHDTEHHRYA